MLKSVFIRNFALLSQAEIDLEPGFTVFTGETGAGKSILVGALSQLLGDRATTKNIRHGADKSELVATFDISQHPGARNWLQANDFSVEDDEVVIRRVIRADGKSRLWINQTPTTAGTVRNLAKRLVQIHGQHDHMRLTTAREQQHLLDEHGQYEPLLQKVREAAESWHDTRQALQQLHADGALGEEQEQLLRYQLAELDELALDANELEALHEEHQRLSHAVELIQVVEQAVFTLSESEHALDARLGQVIKSLSSARGLDLSAVCQALDESLINIEEASADLRRLRGDLKTDPERLQAIEARLDAIHHMARKHKVDARNLPEHHAAIARRLQQNANLTAEQEQLQKTLDTHQEHYQIAAAQLSRARTRAAKKLGQAITTEMRKLGLPDARLEIRITSSANDTPRPEGQDQISFWVSINPGQPLSLLKDTASGGELSRIALAIEVQRRKQTISPMTFIFDEVDTGIGGAVAEKVGQLLRQLANKHQVLAVTHLPQVAGQAHNHIKIQKTTDGQHTESHWQVLDTGARIRELARMTGGETITDTTLAQAREFLASSL